MLYNNARSYLVVNLIKKNIGALKAEDIKANGLKAIEISSRNAKELIGENRNA